MGTIVEGAAPAWAGEHLVEMLALRDVTLDDIAALCGGESRSENLPLGHFRPVSAGPPVATLTWAESASYAAAGIAGGFAAMIVRPSEADLVMSGGLGVVVHPDPRLAIFTAHQALIEAGRPGSIGNRRAAGAEVAPTATIADDVWMADSVVVEAGAVVHANTVLSEGVRIQPGAVVGGYGFQVVPVGGRRVVVHHGGGVLMEVGSGVGAQTCVDRGLFSNFTVLGSETLTDNLVHIAHDVVIGDRCTLTACVELSGGVVLGDDVWLAPGTSTNQLIRIGRGSMTGTGSVVVRDVPPHTLVFGSPARPGGRSVCVALGWRHLRRAIPSCVRRAPGSGVTPLTGSLRRNEAGSLPVG